MSDEDVDLIDEAILAIMDEQEPGRTPSQVAEKVLARLRELSPNELDDWIDDLVRHRVAERAKSLIAARRRRNRTPPATKRSVFADAAGSFAQSNDPSDLRKFRDQLGATYKVGDRTKTLASMTADDLRQAADTFESRGRRSLLEAAFLRSLRKRVLDAGKETVAEVLADRDVTVIWQRLNEDVSRRIAKK